MDLAAFNSMVQDAISEAVAAGRDIEDLQVVTSPPVDDNEKEREIVGIEIVDDCAVLNLGRTA